MPETIPRLSYGLDEAAEAVGLSRRTLQRAIQLGTLRCKRSTIDAHGDPAGRVLIRHADLQAWLDQLPDA